MNTLYLRFIILLTFSAIVLEKASGQCTSAAGTMDLTPISVCGDTTAHAISNNDAVLDSNDVLQFFLHAYSDNSLGFVHAVNTFPDFSYQPASMVHGWTYYISAVVGNDDGTGSVDLNDPCLSVAPGTPVVFNQVIAGCSPFLLFLPCQGEVTAECDAVGGPPLTFQWTPTSGISDPTIQNPVFTQPGSYVCMVSDTNGCTSNAFTIVEPISDSLSIELNVSGTLSCGNEEVTITAILLFGCFPPYNYQWSNGNTGQTVLIDSPGMFSVTVTDAFGWGDFSTITVPFDDSDCGVIKGTLIFDENENCLPDGSEGGLEGWMVEATGDQNYYGVTNDSGGYVVGVLPGDYVVNLIPPNDYWEACQTGVIANIPTADDFAVVDFQVKKSEDCPALEVDLSTPFLRRCMDNNFYVNYCNFGTAIAENAYVEVTFDPLIPVTSSSIPWSGVSGNTYTFDLGDVEVGGCGSFLIEADVSCNAVLGQTLCAEVHIFPDSLCIPSNPAWSGAETQITSECTADSVIFTITNVGTGGMTEPSQFIVIEDGVMFMAPEEFTLDAGGSLTISFPANGSTYVVQANQVSDFPGFSSPLLVVEGCGTNGTGAFSTGFFTQFPEDDGDPFISIDCHEVIGSFDPNDKYGFPKGYGGEHLIEPGQDLDYHIRFQNTGTDTAFTVTIEDVLSPFLDITTLRPGASSHPYKLEIHGTDTLVFIFENILLPDSTLNESASHGFVKFRIGQKAGSPLGTIIENQAAIFFDTKEPVLTNTTTHKLGEHFILTTAREPSLPAFSWAVFPNPFSETTTVVIQGTVSGEVTIRLYDITGRLVKNQFFTGNFSQIQKGNLPPALYFYEILLDGMPVGNGKLAVE